MTQEHGTEENDCVYKDPTLVIREAIEGLIIDLDPDKVLTKARARWMQRALTTLIIELISKFIKGQIEHGDNIENVNLKKEISNEIIDLFWYLSAHTHPMKKK